MNKFLVGLMGFGVVLAAGAMFLQHQAMVEVREEIAALRSDVQQVAKQREATRREAAKAEGEACPSKS